MRGPALLLLAVLLGAAAPAPAVDVVDTRMLAQPAVSAEHVAFVYAGDLWVAPRDGGVARRLTTDEGDEENPRFSPDGRLLAFSAQYDGNTDVYVIPVEGGAPRRLTWHPGVDLVQGFHPEGRSILFTSGRAAHTRRHDQLYTVPVGGGFPTRLPVPHASKATFDPSGASVAYLPLYEPFRQWKNYRGGTASRIWIQDLTDHGVVEVPQPDGRCNDTDPMWVGGELYFLSDRDGEFNLFVWTPGGDAPRRLTDHQDFPVLAAGAGDGVIVYEQAGYLHLFDPSTGTSRRLRIDVAADLVETRPRYVDGGASIRAADISPTGARAVFEARGEIVTVPAEEGAPRNLSHSPGAHDRDPAWSPDGTSIAWLTDASGEYELLVAPQDGRGETRSYGLQGSGFYGDLRFSPDGTRIAYVDNARTLHVLRLVDGQTTAVDRERIYGPIRALDYAWSPDGAWLAYTRNNRLNFRSVHLWSVSDERRIDLTDGLSDVGTPAFDRSGKYLWFFASTDAGPVRQWFAQSGADMELSGTLYLAVLAADTPDPLAPRSDEEIGQKKEPEEGSGASVKVDEDGLSQRILALPLPPRYYRGLTSDGEGSILYLRSDPVGAFGSGPGTLARFDLETREEEVLGEGVAGFRVSHDGTRLLFEGGEDWHLVDLGPFEAGAGRLDTDAIRIRVEPRPEWSQIFHEAWRINRDFFYAPNMHGADWEAMRERYADFLPHLATRDDLTRVIRWMCSELAVGHHRTGGGDDPSVAEEIPGGLLGADYEIDQDRYRFARVYGGLNWNPGLEAPLTKPGVDVRAGAYLLAVDGVELRADENLFARFENTAGRPVELTVGPRPDGRGARTVTVVPIEDEAALRNRAWVEENLRKVTAATDGRVAYVYVPDTAALGHTWFKRYFYPQADREALIVDERHNGGGLLADYYIDLMRRPFISWWATRHGEDLSAPLAAIQGPKAMIIDETAGSGGDLLPWMFREFDLGTLVGRRTWGGLVGILGFPTLMDGGFVTAPDLAIWTEEEGWVVENEGVPPDIEVEQWPAAVNAGRDPQLEKAVEILLEQLPPTPPSRPGRPAYPVRVRR